MASDLPVFLAAETAEHAGTGRNYGKFFQISEMTHRDRTGWLGREDSNLRMAESKSAALPLGYAPIRRWIARKETPAAGT